MQECQNSAKRIVMKLEGLIMSTRIDPPEEIPLSDNLVEALIAALAITKIN